MMTNDDNPDYDLNENTRLRASRHPPQNFEAALVTKDLQSKYEDQLKKALKHLIYTRQKVDQLPKRIAENDEETLETWESFCARFARVVDIFLTKYIKLLVKKHDPAFDGTLLDYLNMAEKMNLLNFPERWLATRELRNIQAHDYTEDELETFLSAVMTECDFILSHLQKQLPNR